MINFFVAQKCINHSVLVESSTVVDFSCNICKPRWPHKSLDAVISSSTNTMVKAPINYLGHEQQEQKGQDYLLKQ
jgi:hypothetical protein